MRKRKNQVDGYGVSVFESAASYNEDWLNKGRSLSAKTSAQLYDQLSFYSPFDAQPEGEVFGDWSENLVRRFARLSEQRQPVASNRYE